MPAVSVIIPNFNHAPYLTQRIESVLKQTFQDFEIIILDDCSTDNSREIIEQYRSNSKVTSIIYNEVNSGSTFRQWDKGINEATGEYIWIAESDDYADTGFLEKMVKNLENNPAVGLVYCQSWRVNEKNEILQSCKEWYTERWRNPFFNNGLKEINDYFLFSGIVNASAAVFRREVALEVDKEYTNFRFCGDWFFWIQVLLRSDLVYLPDELNYFRTHDANVSTQASKNGIRIAESLKILAFIKPFMYNRKNYMRKINIYAYEWALSIINKDIYLRAPVNYKILIWGMRNDILFLAKLGYYLVKLRSTKRTT